jgi:hypothetical protein
MAAAAPQYSPMPKPEIQVVFESEIADQEDSVGVAIPLLGIFLDTMRVGEKDHLNASIPSGRISLSFDIQFRRLGDTVTVVAEVLGDLVKSIRVRQESSTFVAVDVVHHEHYQTENCTLRCSSGTPLTAPGHCIDCAGPKGTVRLCC